MTTMHHSEATYGDEVNGRTWISSFRRGLLCTRQIRLTVGERPLASSTQEWAHVSTKNGVMRAARANADLVAAFPIEGPDESVSLPVYTEDMGTENVFVFQVWHTWMDPLAHANHPVYVDWAEEALARLLHAGGVNPALVQPVAEHAKWRVGAMAPDTVTVTTQRLGRTQDGAVVCCHKIEAEQTGHAATVTTVRRLVDGDSDRLARAVQ
ncbi:MAG: acyl-CoA thioesterase FadM [Myxococcota bacterium]|jgi:acyl-CoA thioesterase FadM